MIRTATLLLAFLLAACGETGLAPPGGDTAGYGPTLTGGTPARPGEFPATLNIKGNCTASRVGPRHVLVAAHCVHDAAANRVHPSFAPGASIGLTNSLTLTATTPFLTYTVEQTYLHPAWTAACRRPCYVNVLSGSYPPDVAVIVLRQPLSPALPEAAVEVSRSAAAGQAAVITGYGCERGLNGGAPSPPRLKLDRLLLAQSTITDARFTGSYFMSPGQRTRPSDASLCYGDSGGPVYRNDLQMRTVIGVNAYYSFSDSSGISTYNWHTRLDSASRHDIGGWLRSLGVTTR